MEKNNKIYISLEHEKTEYVGLNLKQESSDKDWEKAINIFIARIKGRYFSPIRVLSNEWDVNGFVIMATNCLLIETLAQFYYGLRDTSGVSHQKYVDFMIDILFDGNLEHAIADAFYNNIRCGILHSAQTTSHCRLSIDNREEALSLDNGLVVQVELFTILLENYFDSYVEKLNDRTNVTLRKNFIKKMGYICD